MTGFRESEMVSVCRSVHPNVGVPFRIYDCTGYHDKNKPSCAEMQKLAIHVSPGNPKPLGFKAGAGFGETTVRVAVTEDEDSCDEDEDKRAGGAKCGYFNGRRPSAMTEAAGSIPAVGESLCIDDRA